MYENWLPTNKNTAVHKPSKETSSQNTQNPKTHRGPGRHDLAFEVRGEEAQAGVELYLSQCGGQGLGVPFTGGFRVYDLGFIV